VDEAIKIAMRVAVMREGGRLVQYSTPAELLAEPADAYVARFVGSDRTLKRLALIPVRELVLEAPSAAALRQGLPAVSDTGTARDALAAALTSPTRTALVVDAAGGPLGIVNLQAVAAAVASTARRARALAAVPGRA
jgi:osmoprotectant transport system ATP-binding protein